MKKRIKDLTEHEVSAICEKHHRCDGCPLSINDECRCNVELYVCRIQLASESADRYMEREVEIPE